MIKVTYNPNNGFVVEDGKAWKTIEDWISLGNVDVTVSTLMLPVMLLVAVKEKRLLTSDIELYGVRKITGTPVKIPLEDDGEIDENEFMKSNMDIPIIDMMQRMEKLDSY